MGCGSQCEDLSHSYADNIIKPAFECHEQEEAMEARHDRWKPRHRHPTSFWTYA